MGLEIVPEDRQARVRRYRRVMYGFVVLGTAGFVAGNRVGRPLVGMAIYWGGVLGFLGVWRGTPVTLFDERDRAIERRAGKWTLCIAGAVGVVAWSAVFVLAETRNYEPPPQFEGAFLAFVGLYLLFGAVYLVLRVRS